MSAKQDHVRDALKAADNGLNKAVEKTRLMMKSNVWGTPLSDAAYNERVQQVQIFITGGSSCGQGLASRLLFSDTKLVNGVLDEAITSPLFHNALSENLIKAYVRSFRDAYAKIEPEFLAHVKKAQTFHDETR